MSNIILLSLLGVGLLTSFSFIYSVKHEIAIVTYSEIKGSENLDSKIINIRDFNQIEVFDQMRVVVKKGDFSVEVRAEDNLLEFISVEKQGKTLQVERIFKGGENIEQNLPMVVMISAPEIIGFKGSNQAEIMVEGGFNAEDLEIELEQQSNFKGNLSVENLSLSLEQQANASIQGASESLDLTMRDQSGIKAGGFKVREVSVQMGNQSTATVHAQEVITGRLSGNSKLEVKGSPRQNSVSVSRMSQVIN